MLMSELLAKEQLPGMQEDGYKSRFCGGKNSRYSRGEGRERTVPDGIIQPLVRCDASCWDCAGQLIEAHIKLKQALGVEPVLRNGPREIVMRQAACPSATVNNYSNM